MMDPRSEVLLRHPTLFNHSVLLAGLSSDNLLSHYPNSYGWTWLMNDFNHLKQQAPTRIHFGVQPPPFTIEQAILFLPKSKELTQYLLQALASHLTQGSDLYLVGEKRAGVERAAKQLATYGEPQKLDSARHCQLWKVTLQETFPFPNLTTLQRQYTLKTAQTSLNISSLPGVFSHGELDHGTALLLEHLDHLPQGDLLDFGCGAGLIGASLKKQYPHSHVYLQDIDAFALESSRLTLAANQLEATVIAGDGINDAPTKLSAIITNPPFHQGIQTNYHTTEQLLQQAIEHLVIGGELRLVANHFLKYPDIIKKTFGHCEVLANRQGFRLYRARKTSTS